MKFSIRDLKKLDFYPPDMQKFPCLRLAYEAAEAGGSRTIALNAADEVAVAAFLEGDIPFLGIADVIKQTLDETKVSHPESIEQVLAVDAEARCVARDQVVHFSDKAHRQPV